MERLTEKVFAFNGTSCMQIKDCDNDTCEQTCRSRTGSEGCEGCPIQKAFEKLAEYEDLEEQGKLLKLPCAAGDILYYPYINEDGERKIEELEVADVSAKLYQKQVLAEMEGEEVREKDIKELRAISSPLMFEREILIKPTRRFINLLVSALDEVESNAKPEKESEEKSMLHNVTVKREENKVLEKYWLMRAIKDGDMYGQPPTPKRVISEKELDHEPTPNEIAQFLSDSGADFVSVVQNYRFASELPFC